MYFKYKFDSQGEDFFVLGECLKNSLSEHNKHIPQVEPTKERELVVFKAQDIVSTAGLVSIVEHNGRSGNTDLNDFIIRTYKYLVVPNSEALPLDLIQNPGDFNNLFIPGTPRSFKVNN